MRPIDDLLREIVRDVVRQEVRAALAENAARNGSSPGAAGQGYLSIVRAAEFADVAPGTLRRWIRTGRLPARRAGRVLRIGRVELEEFLAGGVSAEVSARARKIARRRSRGE